MKQLLSFVGVVLAFALKSSVAVSGPLVIGNAGGVSELKAIYIHQNLSTYIAGCLVEANPCALRPDEVASLKTVLARHSTERAQTNLRFNNKQTEPVNTVPRPGAEIVISTKVLYDQTGLPRPTGTLGALVLAGRWAHFTSTPLPILYQRSQQIFASFQEKGEHTPIDGFASAIQFHLLHWRFQKSNQVLMMIEDVDKSVDVSAEVQKVLPCGTLLDWNFQNIRTFVNGNSASSNTTAAIAIDSTSACERNTPHTLVIEIVIQNSRLSKTPIKVSLRGA